MKKPSVFGKYLLLERINVGGMAEIFIAKSFGVEGFERLLAIKRILPTMAQDEDFIAMFIDEARISSELTHTNIVHIFELAKHEQSYFIAMEYVAGKDVRSIQERYRRRREAMPMAQAVYIASKMCEGLDYAHRKKDARGVELDIIHRDVSPQNILISYEGEVKIIDFGIAKAANRTQKTEAGILKGKFGYMSPEQVRGLPIDRRSDVFAVGVILYEMITGERLFSGESDFSTLERVRSADVPRPITLKPNLPEGLDRIMMKALAREPEDRYQWASELQEDLQRFLLSGDSIFSAKHLSGFIKDAFAEDLLREAERLERYSKIERPDELEGSSLSIPPSRRTTQTPRPVPSTPPRRTVADDDEPKTQIVDDVFPGSRLEATSPPGFANSDSVTSGPKPWLSAPPVESRRSSAPSGGRPAVVVGSAPEYAGSTVVGPVPNRVSAAPLELAGAWSHAGETRLRPALPDDDEDVASGELLYEDTGRVALATGQYTAPLESRPEPAVEDRRPTPKSRPGSAEPRRWKLAVLLLALVAGAGLGGYRLTHPFRVELVVTMTPMDTTEIRVGGRRVQNNTAVMLPPGDYEVVSSAPGYRSRRDRVRLVAEKPAVALTQMLEPETVSPLSKPSPSGVAGSVTAKNSSAAATFRARFNSSEPGVRVTVEGEKAGLTPQAQKDGLLVGQRYRYIARKAGFHSAKGEFTASASADLTVTVNLVRESPPKPRPERRPRVSEPPPSAVAEEAAVKQGTLICSSNPAGAQVWVDRKDTGRQTPIPKSRALNLPVGPHSVVFKLDERKSEPQHVVIDENAEQSLLNVPLN